MRIGSKLERVEERKERRRRERITWRAGVAYWTAWREVRRRCL